MCVSVCVCVCVCVREKRENENKRGIHLCGHSGRVKSSKVSRIVSTRGSYKKWDESSYISSKSDKDIEQKLFRDAFVCEFFSLCVYVYVYCVAPRPAMVSAKETHG